MLGECLLRLQVETLTILLTSLIGYHLISYIKHKRKKSLLFVSALIGYLILTKIFFSVVFILMIIVLILFYLFSPSKRYYFKRYLQTLLLGLLFTLPYLAYTYYVTGKPMYYSNAGGLSFYWMSTPYEGETGDWHFFDGLPEGHFIKKNHQSFFSSIKDLNPVEKDQALKEEAIKNILNNKVKFAKNLLFNLERLFIMMPTTFQKTTLKIHLVYYFPHIIIFILLIFSSILTLLKLKRLPPILIFLALLSTIYIGTTLLFSAFTRFLYPIFPILFIWIAYTIGNFFNWNISNLNE